MSLRYFALFVLLGLLPNLAHHRAQAQSQTQATYREWAATPPMGWNSWDCFGTAVTERDVLLVYRMVRRYEFGLRC